MKTKTNKLLSIVLSIAMLLSLVPSMTLPAFAADGDTTTVEAEWGTSASSLTKSGTLSEAITAVLNGTATYIRLNSAASLNDEIKISDKEFTVDMNGNKLYNKGSFKLSGSAKMTVTDTGKELGEYTSEQFLAFVEGNATLIIEKGNYNNFLVDCWGDSNIIINGGTINAQVCIASKLDVNGDAKFVRSIEFSDGFCDFSDYENIKDITLSVTSPDGSYPVADHFALPDGMAFYDKVGNVVATLEAQKSYTIKETAKITGMSITVDGTTYDKNNTSAENPAVITLSTQSVTITVTGTNLQNGTGDNGIWYNPSSTMRVSPQGWEISEDGTSATKTFPASYFKTCTTAYEIKYTNDDSTYTGSGVSVLYSIPEEDKAVIQGVSITVDGTTYTSGTATITPSTQSITITVTGTNLQNGTDDNCIQYNSSYAERVKELQGWNFNNDGTSATKTFPASYFKTCTTAYEIKYTNTGSSGYTGSGVSVIYSNSTAVDTTAKITGVSNITVDGVEYTSGQTATITPDTQSVTITVTGTNLQNGTIDNCIMYAENEGIIVAANYGWTFSDDGTSATRTFIVNRFADCTTAFEIQYSNDGSNYIGSGVSVRYTVPNFGLAEIDPYQGEGTLGAVKVGDEITYGIGFKNYKQEAADVTIKVPLDQNVAYVSADSGTYDEDAHSVTLTIKDVPAGATGTVTLTVKVLDGALNTGKVKMGPAKVQVGNDPALTTDSVTNPVPENPELMEVVPYEGTGTVGAVKAGDEITYQIRYKNYQEKLADVTIEAPLDQNVEFVSADNGGTYDEDAHSVTWTIKNVPAGATGTVTLTVKVKEDASEVTEIVARSAAVKVGNDREFTTNILTLPVISADDVTVTYDGKEHSIDVKRVPQGATVTYSTDEVNYDETNPTFKNVADSGTVYYQVKLASDVIVSGSATVTINPKEIGISWGPTQDLPYTGSSLVPQATATDLVDGDECILTTKVVETAEGAGIIPGTWTAKVTALSNDNYKLPESVTTSFVIITAGQNDAPNVGKADETIDGKADGKITGVDSTMEYRKDGETEYTAISGTEITDLADGTYYVRYAAKQYYNASPDKEVVIGVGRKLTVTVPATQTGYTLGVADTELVWNGSTMLTFVLADGYSKTNEFAVTATGATIADNGDGTYTISNAEYDVVITVTGVADITAPDVTLSMKTVDWKQFFNKITFGLFFKNNVEVKVEATDLGSGIQNAEYLVTDTAFTTEDAVKADTSTWTALTLDNGVATFNVTEQGKKYVYVRVTDDAGNIKVVNSDGGVVVYTDSAADTTAISFTKTTTDDVTAKVNLNGNTVKDIYNGTTLIDSEDYSVAQDGTVTIKASYLDTLEEGQYTLHIVYNPQGETYSEYTNDAGENINDEPAQTTITLTIRMQRVVLPIDFTATTPNDGTPNDVEPGDNNVDIPATGDNNNLWLWFALLFVSGAGVLGITLYDRKRKAASKR